MSITATGLRAGYVPDVDILKGVDLHVDDSEIVTILGPNGSGKSTVLKALMGFVAVREGKVDVNGEDCTSLLPHRRARKHGVAFVPQLDNVFGPLTLRDNLRADGLSMKRGDRERRVSELLDQYPALGRRPGARADSLSGGERQMLALCRALMPRPRVLMLDEPSAGLSPVLVTTLFETIAAVRSREELTVLVVEQNATQSLAVSDRGYVLVQGEVAMTGTADALLNDPHVSELYLGGLPEDIPESIGGAPDSPSTPK